MPTSVTFGATETEKTITFTATHDTVDDGGESVKLSFRTLPTTPIAVTAGTHAETTVSITDDDLPAALTVSFAQAAYTVAESDDATTLDVTENEVAVTVTLSEDPETTLVIPISRTNQDGAEAGDYTVPTSVTFGATETEKTITFTATPDTVDDGGESVKLSFGTLPTTPIAVTAGTHAETTVSITDDDLPAALTERSPSPRPRYTVAESDDATTLDVTENEVAVTVTLSEDPETTLPVIPISRTNQDGAEAGDYTVPTSVTFAGHGDREDHHLHGHP